MDKKFRAGLTERGTLSNLCIVPLVDQLLSRIQRVGRLVPEKWINWCNTPNTHTHTHTHTHTLIFSLQEAAPLAYSPPTQSWIRLRPEVCVTIHSPSVIEKIFSQAKIEIQLLCFQWNCMLVLLCHLSFGNCVVEPETATNLKQT